MLDRQRYIFDVQGYLVLPGVLDLQQVARLRALLETRATDPRFGGHFPPRDDGSVEALDFVGWDAELAALLDNDRVTAVLGELLGTGYRLDHYYGMRQPRGTGLLALHGGGHGMDETFYACKGGQIRTGLTVVSWALSDTPAAGGGFACVPGSHKANFSLPEFADAFFAGEIVALPEAPDLVREVPVKAGDVLVFTEALAHAATTWQGEDARWALLFKYCPGWASWARHRPPSSATLTELTERQRLLFEAPYVESPRDATTLGVS
ncbi:MAG: phytanoyl-CoA dioxygenase family protein [Frankiaceae bacterium]|nr:phytanoyl-CoA dioxygenase family protein [Frankiaceae bacterium]